MNSRFFSVPNEISATTARPPLLLGLANSMWQASGDKRNAQGEVITKSNWSEGAGKNGLPQFGNAYHHYDSYETDMDIMQAAGYNCYRFSIEWKDIEPNEGELNEIALAHYEKIIAACLARKMTPMVTLLHFVEPYWFTQKGGFEKEENIEKHFLPHCGRLFRRFGNKVKFWCTINEPAVQAFSGYLYGQFPPHRHSLEKTVTVLLNLLKAHVAVYFYLKQLTHGPDAQIGIVHNILKFIPGYRWEPIEAFACSFLTEITNDLVMKFFQTGEFHYHKWPLVRIDYAEPAAKFSNDFIGLNYYASAVIGFNRENVFGPTCFAGDVMGDMFLRIDSAGFAAAIDAAASLKLPIYVTEIGIAAKTDAVRAQFYTEYLDVFARKRAEGINLRGLCVWSLFKNIEWNQGESKDFGIYRRDGSKTQGAVIYENWVRQQLPQDAADLAGNSVTRAP